MSKRSSLKAQRQASQAKAARLKQIRYGGLMTLILLAVVGLINWRNATVVPPEETAALVKPHLDGPANAPAQVVEFADLTCSACKQWHNLGIKEQLQAEFGEQVSFEFRHFPVITASSPKGAEAAQCAAEQDGFWPFHDYIFENLESYPNLSTDRVKEIAAAAGLDRAAFDSCLDSGQYREFTSLAIQQAQAAGVRGTPTFFINGQPVNPSYAAMSEAIGSILRN